MPTREIPDRFQVAFSFAGETRALVHRIAEAVETRLGRGRVFYDAWFEHWLAGAGADLKLQDIYENRCDLAVVCVCERYGDKAWTGTEYEVIRARAMQARTSEDPRERDAILPIRVGDGDVPGIPFNAIVPDVRERGVEEAADLIVERLRLVLAPDRTQKPAEPEWPDNAPDLIWPMADHDGVRESFAALLTRAAPWRFVPIAGPSETGKSHITRQMLANALRIPALACGRFDFKGGIDKDAELRAFVAELGVPDPPPSPLLNERLGRVLSALAERRHPTLLIFDTYEQAAQPQRDWIEKELLVRLIRAPWLRVALAGQRVPDCIGAVWASVARQAIELEHPRPADWYDYGKAHKPGLTLEFVEQAYRYAAGKGGLLAQLLGPGV